MGGICSTRGGRPGSVVTVDQAFTRSVSRNRPFHYGVAMSDIDPLPATGENAAPGTPRVSTALGTWSVLLGVGSPVIGWVRSWILVFALSPIGSMVDRDYLAALRIGYIVLFFLIASFRCFKLDLSLHEIHRDDEQ